MINHVRAILWKQIKDTFKNKAILIQFLMFPLMTIIMENSISMEGLEEHFFVNMFATMYVGMAPIVSMCSILAEEKETNTLRVLYMANVKAGEYLIGNAIYIWIICMVGSLVMGVSGGYRGELLIKFLVFMAIGHLVSILIGATIGVFSKNQMMATSFMVPVMMVFSFVPMISMFNETVKKVAKVLYSQQLSLLLHNVENAKPDGECVVVVLINVLVIGILFVTGYRKMSAGCS